MKIISILNQKGGTGKTTIAVNLGKALSLLKKKILLIDFDPQGNLTYSLGIKPEKGTMAEVIHGVQTIQAILVKAEDMDVAPCSRELADIEISLVSKMGREQKLKQALKSINKYDYVFIDCPPSLSILSINALTASDEVIIPLQMEILSLQAVTQILSTIAEVKKVLNKNLRVKGILPIMYDARRRLSEEILTEIKKSVKERIFNSYIRENVKIAEAPSFAKSVLEYDPTSHGAEDFKKLAREFIS